MKNEEKLKNDIIDSIYKAYDEGQIPYDSLNRNFDDVFSAYLNLLHRLIGPKKRIVYLSKELESKIEKDEPEAKRLKTLVYDMKDKFENGVDVNGCLSKTIVSQIDKSDKMLDDWNIKHLHLGMGTPDFFDKGRTMTKDLLFVVVLSNEVYFLDVTEHGRDDWYNIDFVNIMKNNWADQLLIKHENTTIEGNGFKSIEDIKMMRNSNINSIMHEIDGCIYSPKYALGYSMAGTSAYVRMQCNAFYHFIDEQEFDYDRIEFNNFCIGCIGKIYNKANQYLELFYNVI